VKKLVFWKEEGARVLAEETPFQQQERLLFEEARRNEEERILEQTRRLEQIRSWNFDEWRRTWSLYYPAAGNTIVCLRGRRRELVMIEAAEESRRQESQDGI